MTKSFKMTPARKRVLKTLARLPDGDGSRYEVGYPMAPLTHALFMEGLIEYVGARIYPDRYRITDKGLALIKQTRLPPKTQ